MSLTLTFTRGIEAMALSEKVLQLLKQIYAYRRDGRRLGREALVDEDPDEALEYVLQEIVSDLTSRLREDAASPLYTTLESAVGRLHLDRQERHTAKTS